MEKKSMTIRAIKRWNNTQHQFSNLSLKTYSPAKIKSLLKYALENVNQEVKRGNFN